MVCLPYIFINKNKNLEKNENNRDNIISLRKRYAWLVLGTDMH